MALHWLTVLALLMGVTAIWWREAVDDKALREVLLTVHRQLGLLVWLALAARLLARMGLPKAIAAEPLPWHVRTAAALSHAALYLVLFLQPLFGWIMSNAHGKTVRLFGVWPLPNLIDADPDMADLWADRHETLAWVLAALVALHIAAALWHHFFLRDGVLRAMLPRRP